MNKITIQQIKLGLDHKPSDIDRKICQLLKIHQDELIRYKITKKSVDARKKEAISFSYCVDVEIKNELKKGVVDGNNIMLTITQDYQFPCKAPESATRPIVIGSGPAGLFCALLLAENGFKPIVLERGESVEKRHQAVESFFRNKELNENSNIQFGEGGAGTYSDGKLNSQVKDPHYRKEKVLASFIEAGAPEEISYSNKPHIGTDYLIKVVKNMRQKIEGLGGEVRFNQQVTSLIIEGLTVKGVVINGSETLYGQHIVLAIGHSARDTFEALKKAGIPMEAKAFAIGLRIEHPQKMISKSQFGALYEHKNLPVADYKLTHRSKSGRGVYTFCMCPGGYVVNASSEASEVVCNGMSYFKRNSDNANSAVVVNVTPEDFESKDVLAGVHFQRKWEKAAFEQGGGDYRLPLQLFGDFMSGNKSIKFGEITPVLKGQYQFADLNLCLPGYVSEALKEGILAFDQKIKGFARADAILTGVETRTSSPVRILRNEQFESTITGLYPCGEGAGYAGGIMSAAMDGIKVAEQIAKNSCK
ncbi:MAG: FAD-binding protein [Vallitaleaceae bacterium]|nr:FAD-binding protein [Vallitaleaceae bacterium]